MSSLAHQHREDVELRCRASRAEPAPPSLPWVEELTPAPEPEEIFLRLADLPQVLFFDSALRHPALGRYSFLTADPFERLWARGTRTAVSTESGVREPADPFGGLAER